MNKSDITGNDSSFLKTLAKHIATQLRKRGFCIVFEDDLERCWPSIQMSEAERESEIQRLAKSRRWSAKIVEGGFGTRAIFEKLEPDVVDYGGSPEMSSQ